MVEAVRQKLNERKLQPLLETAGLPRRVPIDHAINLALAANSGSDGLRRSDRLTHWKLALGRERRKPEGARRNLTCFPEISCI